MLEHNIWWQVYPLGALGAPIRPDWPDDAAPHRLRRLVPWLDYLIKLGCNGLILGPIFESSTHGYDTTDHFRIDNRLGTDDDFDYLMEACAARGISVLLDGVFNHVGVNHPLTQQALESHADASTEPHAQLAATSPVLITPQGNPQHWEGHLDLAELDHSNQATEELVVAVMEHWLDRGIAGWRLDVAYAVPLEFWARVTGRVRRRFPQAIFLGEMIHGDYPSLVESGGLDTVTQYELWKGIWSSIKDRNLWELAHSLERHAEFSRRAPMQIFVGNHDVDRIASILDDAGAALAAAILFTLPGIPSVYQGDEQAFRGVKGEGPAADDPIRPPLPATPQDLALQGAWMFDHYRALIAMRRRHPWLATAALEVLDKENERIEYRCTGTCEQEGTPEQVDVTVDLTAMRLTMRFSGQQAATEQLLIFPQSPIPS